jgi:hypothetical protein
MNSFMQDPNVAHTIVRQVTTERIAQAEASGTAREVRRQRRETSAPPSRTSPSRTRSKWMVAVRRSLA